MARRPSVTVILCSGRTACRADFAGGDAALVSPVVKIDIQPGSELPSVVSALAHRGEKIGTRVLVLTAEAWTHMVRFPAAGLRALPDDELTQALKYEVESLTGLGDEAMALAHRRLADVGNDAQFWISVWSEAQCREVFEALAQQGARSVAFAHPAGTANSQTISDGVIGQVHAEYWPNLVAEFGGADHQLTAITQGPSALQKWRENLASGSFFTGGATLVRGFGTEALPSEVEICVQNLSQDDALENWLRNVARQNLDNCPRLVLSPHRPAQFSRLLVAGLALIVALTATVWHGRWLRQRGERIENEIATVQQLITRQENDDAELLRLAGETEQLSGQLESTGQQLVLLQFFLDQQVGRLGKLLVWLLELRTEDVLIRELKPHERGMSIVGLSLNSESAPQLANQLRDAAQPFGWRVSLGAQIGAKTLVSGGPWEFEIILEDVGHKSTAGVISEANRPEGRLTRDNGGATHAR